MGQIFPSCSSQPYNPFSALLDNFHELLESTEPQQLPITLAFSFHPPQFTPISLKIIQVNDKIFYVYYFSEQNDCFRPQIINPGVRTLVLEI